MSAQPARGEARVVRARITARERLVRIFKYHELLVGMVRKELKVKYKNSVLGFAWSLLNPLLYLVVFYIAFEKILHSGIPAFPIYLLSGLLVHFFLQSMVLFVVLAVAQWHVAWAYLPLLPVALIALLLVTGSLGILLSATNVYLRDTQHFLELALLAWFWVTPIVYQFELVANQKGWFSKVWMANPVTPIVIVFQRAIYAKLDNTSTTPPTPLLPHWPYWGYVAYLGMSFAFGFIVLALAVRVFGRAEANFAEEL